MQMSIKIQRTGIVSDWNDLNHVLYSIYTAYIEYIAIDTAALHCCIY